MKQNTYIPIQQVSDQHPIRAVCFHPSGEAYAIGTNSKALKICKYPGLDERRELINSVALEEPEVLFKCLRVHCASVYCAAFNSVGNLLATGSNDQIVHVMKYDPAHHAPLGKEFKLTMHDGTIRAVCFLHDNTREATSSRLLSAGAGDFGICATNCDVMKSTQVFRGHEATVMTLDSCRESTDLFVSGSLDGTIRLWDLRSKNATTVGCSGVPVGCVRLDSSGRLLVSGHQDGSCMLYDIRASKIIQLFKAHLDEIRTLDFSPESSYLLSASYDRKVKLTDLQGQLTKPLPCVEVAELDDKVVQVAWHPKDYNFVTTCADGKATLWTVPDFEEWCDSMLMETSVIV